MSEVGFVDPQEMQDLLDDMSIQIAQLKSMALSTLGKPLGLGLGAGHCCCRARSAQDLPVRDDSAPSPMALQSAGREDHAMPGPVDHLLQPMAIMSAPSPAQPCSQYWRS